jgi:hypothetical protein
MHKIFVFGSNLAGVHGAGAAAFAVKEKGAIWSQGVGLQGNSYGIPTKDYNIQTLPLERVKYFVDQFIEFAEKNPEMTFEVTAIGCGLAGFTAEQIAPLFSKSPQNCTLPEQFAKIIDWKGATWVS